MDTTRLFVLLVNAQDRECQATVNDLFIKASHPERVFLGLYDAGEQPVIAPPGIDPAQIRVVRQSEEQLPGFCAAQHAAQRLYDGEEFVLVGESCMRFVIGWDFKFIAMLELCDSASPVLSNHPAYFVPPNVLEESAHPTYLQAVPSWGNAEIRFESKRLKVLPTKPLRGAFVSSRMLFSRSDLFARVPFDPYLDEPQADISLSLRLFTHGFDIYHPRSVLAFHLPIGAPSLAPNAECGKQRFAFLRNAVTQTDQAYLVDLDRYTLGVARSLEAFEAFSGLNLKHNTTSPRAEKAEFIEDLARYTTPSQPAHPEPGRTATTEDVNSILTFTDAVLKKEQPIFDITSATFNRTSILPDTPRGILIMKEYLTRSACERIVAYGGSQSGKPIGSVELGTIANGERGGTMGKDRNTEYVKIDGMACDIINLFNDIFCNRVAPFYDVAFQYYERPQLLRYPVGGHYHGHADSECWDHESGSWRRMCARDYSVVLYLNDDFEGGEFEFIDQKYRIRPEPGMLLAFPSDHRFQHAALPTRSGIRYALVSWAKILGTPETPKWATLARVDIYQQAKI